ncbi:hypothetical protein AX16_008055 [Volvariella volvacea WC 439]|nr:hypothetical protein AX16_008055 [Volvariella volvacea WC 439]
MSLARLFNEFRPLFRMLDEPISRAGYLSSLPARSAFDDPFFRSPYLARPAVDVTEQGNKYVVEADLPGVSKENVQVRIGDNGRSITIEGKTSTTRPVPDTATADVSGDEATQDVTKGDTGQKISTERAYSENTTFTRTVWLPRPVDANNVNAKLENGVLNVTLGKAEDKGSVTIPVN